MIDFMENQVYGMMFNMIKCDKNTFAVYTFIFLIQKQYTKKLTKAEIFTDV